jgi:hypothetical protein
MNLSSYIELLYPNNTNLPVPNNENQLYLIYKLPNHSNELWDKWNELPKYTEVTFDKNNPNKSIKLGETIANHGGWAQWGPFPLIWRNPYNHAQAGKNVKGILPSDKYVEVTSRLPQGGPGNWLNVNPGSGMFFKLGDKRLITRNKVSALVALGITTQQIADKYGENFEWNGWGSNSTTWGEQKEYIKTTFGIDSLSELLTNVATNPNNIIALEWVGNCPILDRWTYSIAKDKGYDMIQFYCAGYSGFWSNEFVWIEDISFDELAKERIQTTSGQCSYDQSNYLSCYFKGLNSPTTYNCIWIILIIIVLTIILLYILHKLI